MIEKTAARSKPRRITDYCAALVFYFQHILKFLFSGKMIATVIGNLDPWYLLGPWYLWKNRKESKKLKASLIVISIFFLYGILQLIVFPNMSILKLAVTLLKLAVCILCMLYVMENAEKINFLRIAKIISVFYGITLPFALFFNQSPLFWITNDYVNKYTTTRLRLFYYEPSELGFRLIIVMVVLIGFFLASKCKKEKVLLAVLILVDAFTLYLARSMGAIGIGALAIGVMFLYDWIAHNSRKKTVIYSCICAALLLFCVMMAVTQSDLYMRLMDTLQGKDSSNSYRIGLSFRILGDSFWNYWGLGCGFGNVNTPAFLNQYTDWGLKTVITNSYVYYMTETGIFGVLTLGGFISILFYRCVKGKSAVKWGLFVFIVVFQFMGGYLTNGLNWVAYGIILSNFNERNVFKELSIKLKY